MSGFLRGENRMRQLRWLPTLIVFACPFGFTQQTSQTESKFSKEVLQYIRVHAPKVVLAHVRVVDGTGRAAVDDQNVVIEGGKISAIQPGTDVAKSKDVEVLDLRGYSVMPGIVGMHDHLFYVARPNLDSRWHGNEPLLAPQMTYSAPRLYLAAGVTTMRTTGSVETFADLNLRDRINAGLLPGPHIDVTGPYLEGKNSYFIQMHELGTAEEARDFVDYWADRGVTSFKAYMNITRAELKAAIDEAHKRNIKVTGHLCSVDYKEAAELGIDDLEHGFFVNTQLDPGKKPDMCSDGEGTPTLKAMAPDSAEAKDLIDTLVKHHVAVTSTLPVFESGGIPGRPPLRQAFLDVLSPQAREAYLYRREKPVKEDAPVTPVDSPGDDWPMLIKRDMQLELAFSKAGGLLLAGPDPTGDGGVAAGLGDQREIELLVEAGLTPVEAIKVATMNGAVYMGKQDQIGSVAVGKNADLVVVKGNPAERIADVENVEIVFKDGVGYDSQKLLESVMGRYGEY
jgi:imidazolonepropionase-like amidohydrolase